MKKIISLILSVVMACSVLVPFTASAIDIPKLDGFKYVNEANSAKKMSLDKPVTVSLNAKEAVYFEFTPSADGFYEIRSNKVRCIMVINGFYECRQQSVSQGTGSASTFLYDVYYLFKGCKYYILLLHNTTGTTTLTATKHTHKYPPKDAVLGDEDDKNCCVGCAIEKEFYKSYEIDATAYHRDVAIKKEEAKKKQTATVKSLKAGKNKVGIKWKKVSGATGYQIQYGTKSNFKGAKTVKIKNGKTTSKTIKKLKKGKKYYFRVRAVKKNKNLPWSGKKSCKVK